MGAVTTLSHLDHKMPDFGLNKLRSCFSRFNSTSPMVGFAVMCGVILRFSIFAACCSESNLLLDGELGPDGQVRCGWICGHLGRSGVGRRLIQSSTAVGERCGPGRFASSNPGLFVDLISRKMLSPFDAEPDGMEVFGTYGAFDVDSAAENEDEDQEGPVSETKRAFAATKARCS